MNNKEIQEKRIRGYFIDATREMLKGEGIRSINVRAVADRAGYSYATLYNYFKDIKELVFICVKDFQEEAEAIINEKAEMAAPGKEKIKTIMKSYISYFVQYPGIFELFFIEKMNDLGARQPTASLIYSFPDRLCEDQWQFCIRQNILTEEKAESIKNELRFVVTGMLLFYMHRGQPASYDEFIKMVDNQLNQVLDF